MEPATGPSSSTPKTPAVDIELEGSSIYRRDKQECDVLVKPKHHYQRETPLHHVDDAQVSSSCMHACVFIHTVDLPTDIIVMCLVYMLR